MRTTAAARSRAHPGAPAIGLDFGTSNCLAAWLVDGAPTAIALEDGHATLPSLVQVPRVLPPPPSPTDTWLNEAVRRARRVNSSVSEDDALRRRLRAEFERDAMAQAHEAMQRQTLLEALQLGATPRFGRAALAASLEDPDGFFFRSPKSFLAADIETAFRARFQRVVQLMLTHLRELASATVGADVRQACIGRPVHFGGGSPADQARGDERAIALLTEAAHQAGFAEVRFEYEPVAAAFDFERTLNHDQVVLIVDVGGGTTDCTIARLGPGRAALADRSADILASSGDRIGGNDVDTALSFAGLMTVMGRGDQERSGLPVPPTPFADAASVFNLPAQQAFFRSGPALAATRRRCAPEVAARLARLETLRETQQTLWLTTRAEQAKLALAESDEVRVALERLEEGLNATVHQAQLAQALRGLLQGVERLMRQVAEQALEPPERIYVTGGSARAPAVQALIRSQWPALPVVIGDAFGSVVSGLAMRASRLFGPSR